MKALIGILIVIGLALVGVALLRQQTLAADLDQSIQAIVEREGLAPLAAPPAQDPALVALGQMLFFDKELSGNRDTSCATCHQMDLGTSDGLRLSIGTGGSGVGPARQLGDNRTFVPRNALELYNRGLPEFDTMFWDARVAGSAATGFVTPAGAYLPNGLDNVLAAQAMFPVTFRDEMRGGWYNIAGYITEPGEIIEKGDYADQPAGWNDVDVFGNPNELAGIPNGPENNPAIWEAIMQRLLAIPGYQALFQQAFPGVPLAALGFQHAANAIAAFETQAFSLTDSPWDRYLAGDQSAISNTAKQGALLFFGPAGCATCHSGDLFTDHDFHNLAVPQFGPGRDPIAPLDFGHYEATLEPADKYTFRTPSLRNVALTAPYFHNGTYTALEDVINHHLQPEASLRAFDGRQLPPELRDSLQNNEVTLVDILATLDPKLDGQTTLTNREIRQIIAFLQSLTDPAAKDLGHLVPAAVPSGLEP